MSIPDVTIGKQINYGNKYRFTLFNESIFQLIFFHDVRTEEKYFTPSNVRQYFGRYMYSLLSNLEAESLYKTNDKYEFILQYPELNGSNYNCWRQSLSPTIQTEDNIENETGRPQVLGYENLSIHYTSSNWGGLSLSGSNQTTYVNGNINTSYWHYAIGCYGYEKGIPGPFGNKNYLKLVALYVKIASLDMIMCVSCKVYRNLFLNPHAFLFVFILM